MAIPEALDILSPSSIFSNTTCILVPINPNPMTLHRAKMQRQGRDKKQESKFFLWLGICTLLLILILYLVYG